MTTLSSNCGFLDLHSFCDSALEKNFGSLLCSCVSREGAQKFLDYSLWSIGYFYDSYFVCCYHSIKFLCPFQAIFFAISFHVIEGFFHVWSFSRHVIDFLCLAMSLTLMFRIAYGSEKGCLRCWEGQSKRESLQSTPSPPAPRTWDEILKCLRINYYKVWCWNKFPYTLLSSSYSCFWFCNEKIPPRFSKSQ